MVSEMEKNKHNLIETLMKGRDNTKKLQNMRRRKVTTDGSVSVDDLLSEILGSLTAGLSMLNGEIPEVYTGKKPVTGVKEKRGCYKRRRTNDSRMKISDTIEDGYGWRKYGQKEILNSTSPRCYFRCTHKPLQGCKAQKQVQKLEDGSNLFHITYIGYHTCFTTQNQEVVLDFKNSKNYPHFSNNPSTITNDQTEPSIKQEVDSKAQSMDVSDNISSANNGHSSPTLGWNEVFMIDDHLGTSTSSYNYLNMDFLDNRDILSDIQLDEDIFSRLH